ncbi:hypothetical protein [Roseovarius sp. EL26]|uniref:hypothetical protein n=1 Tax=Roseovarius sp. EL26 TaxID=2126672 RepID=UPI000EA00195|nr:hypothetical protein [Roseovarius sp. EL26]
MCKVKTLLFPTYLATGKHPVNLEEAVDLANRVLRENNSQDFEAYIEGARLWRDYYLCSYRNIEQPNEVYGGGATLVVRKSDGLSGMIFVMADWLELDENIQLAPIEQAYEKFDRSKK